MNQSKEHSKDEGIEFPKARGLFIVIEGLDRSGKTTQIDYLEKYFQQKFENQESLDKKNQPKVIQMHFPDRSTPSGKDLDKFLRKKMELSDEDAHLLFSKNRWEKAYDIRKLVEEENTVIICSRYAYSGVVYTYMKGKQTMEWCMNPDRGLPQPDIVIFLEIDPEIAAQRGAYGEERYETIEAQKKVRKAFSELLSNDTTVVNVSANNSVDKIHSDIVQAVEKKWKEISGPLKKLWME